MPSQEDTNVQKLVDRCTNRRATIRNTLLGSLMEINISVARETRVKKTKNKRSLTKDKYRND